MGNLLQRVHFVIHTDHENLTQAYSTGSAKVFRWKMFMQEFSYFIVLVKGKNNVVADAISRLCPDFMHNDDGERNDMIASLSTYSLAFWTTNRWSPMSDPSTSCTVLE
jgi:hypothetical protein